MKIPRLDLLFLSAAVVFGGFLGLPAAQAALIAEQEYNGLTFGFNNPFIGGTSQTGLTYSTLLVSGSSQNFSNNPQSSFTGGALSNNASQYICFLLDTTGNLGGRAGFTLFASGFQDGNGGGSGTEVAEVGQAGGFIRILTGNYGTANATPNAFQNIPSTTATSNGTNFYVIGITSDSGANTSSISLYYNPTTSIAPAPLLTFSALPAFHLEQIRAYGNATWDEIRVGASFAEVTPGLPIPEPASAALVGIGLSSLLWRWRSKTS